MMQYRIIALTWKICFSLIVFSYLVVVIAGAKKEDDYYKVSDKQSFLEQRNSYVGTAGHVLTNANSRNNIYALISVFAKSPLRTFITACGHRINRNRAEILVTVRLAGYFDLRKFSIVHADSQNFSSIQSLPFGYSTWSER